MNTAIRTDHFGAVLRQTEKLVKLEKRLSALAAEIARETYELAKLRAAAAKAGR